MAIRKELLSAILLMVMTTAVFAQRPAPQGQSSLAERHGVIGPDFTAEERDVIVAALKKKLADVHNNQDPLHVLDNAIIDTQSGHLRKFDCTVLNTALMMSGDDRAPAILSKIRTACTAQ